MTIFEFVALTQEQQLTYVADAGMCLSQRSNEGYDITLYRMGEFFVEVYFDRRKMAITQLSAFCGVELLEAFYEDQAPASDAANLPSQLNLKPFHLYKN